MKKELFVCERTLLTDLCCAFLCTHGNACCGHRVTCFFCCQMQWRKAAGLRATCATHTLSDWCLVVLFVSVRTLAGKSEALLIHSCSHRARCCARVFPCSCSFSLCCRDRPLLWSPNCSGSHTFHSNFRNPLSSHVVVWCLLLFLRLGFDFAVLAPRQLLSSPTVR